MTGRTHDLAAFTTLSYIIVTHPVHSVSLATGLVAITANLVGGIAPDIDQPTAPLWKNLPIGGLFGRVFDKLLGGHRFLSHSLIGAAIFGFGFHYILILLTPSFPHLNMNIIWWAFIIGYFSHLVMDTITREGVPWLLPLPYRFGFPPYKDFRVQTGSWVERLVVFPILMIVCGYIFYTHYHQFLILIHQIAQ